MLTAMSRTLVVALCAIVLVPGCKKKTRNEPAPPAVAAVDAGQVSRIPPPTEPDVGYEERRRKLLERGNPEVMPTSPIPGTRPAAPSAAELVKAVSKDVLMVGSIRVDLAKGTAELPAKVVAVDAPLEYIATTPWGKAYESMLSVTATAVELRLALTLLGFEGTVPDASGKVASPTAADTVTAELRVGDKQRPLGWYLIDRRSKKPLADAAWQVIGFRESDRENALNVQELVTIIPRDHLAPLRLTVDVGNVYAGPDKGLVADPKKVPAAGSDVTLVLVRRPGAPAAPTPSPSMTGETK